MEPRNCRFLKKERRKIKGMIDELSPETIIKLSELIGLNIQDQSSKDKSDKELGYNSAPTNLV